MEPLEQSLPELYARWMGELLPGPIPREERATCHDCAMCVSDGRVPTATYYFRPEVKCCVYTPHLANFLVGRILGDEDPDGARGRASVRARLEAKLGVTPVGIAPSASYDLLSRNAVNATGNSEGLLCPHYLSEDGGRCGIWKHREATCSTWFCRFQRGGVGYVFWQHLRNLLHLVERELAWRFAHDLGISAEALRPLIPAAAGELPPMQRLTWYEVDGKIDERGYVNLWGEWAGKEEAFYDRCRERVEALTWPEVLAICGSETAIRAALLEGQWERLVNPTQPDRLCPGEFTIHSGRESGLRAVTYSTLDAIDLPAQLLPLLHRFDGRPAREVLAEIKDAYNVEIRPEYFQELIDWGVLVDAGYPRPARLEP